MFLSSLGSDAMSWIRTQTDEPVPRYTITTKVRMRGQTPDQWSEELTIRSGDVVEVGIEFTNTGTEILEQLAVIADLPDHFD